MKNALLALALLAAAAGPARADEAHDLAADIVQQTGSDARIDQVFTLARQTIVAQMAARSGKTTADAGAIFDQVILPGLRRAVPRVRAVAIDIYVHDYDLSDLRALDTFYRSPAGRHVLQRQPQVAVDTAQAMLALIRDLVGQIIRDNAAQLHQKGVDL